MKSRVFQKRGCINRAFVLIGILLFVAFSTYGCSPLEQMGIHPGNGQKAEQCQESQRSKRGEKTGAKEAEIQTEALLGALNKKITSKEKTNLQLKVEEVQKLEKTNFKDPKISLKKEAKIQEVNRYLDQLTKKYFPGWKNAQAAWDESYESEPYDKKAMLKILQAQLSTKDYKKFQKMYDGWLDADVDEEMGEALYQDMESLLSAYPPLDASSIMEDLTDLATQTLAVFVRENNGEFSYQSGEQRALPELSSKEQEECREYIRTMEAVLPPEAVACFDTVSIFTDGTDGTYAYVNQLDEDAKTWNFSMDKADMEYPEEFCYTAIHEYAHYLSLNHQQMLYPKEPSSSKTAGDIYHDDTFEARKDSYIQAYYEKYWRFIHDDRRVNQDSVLFYLRHHQEFINSYAATDCAEDFAETFAWYVLDDKVPDPAVQRKIDFFKGYPQLEKEKERIRSRMEQHHIRPERYSPEYEDWKSIMGE